MLRKENVWGNQEFYYEHVKYVMFIRQVGGDVKRLEFKGEFHAGVMNLVNISLDVV